MLYLKPINEITCDDVITFCKKQVKENIILDYKRDFPKKFENTISAMSNTHGGLIVIGIEDEDGKPKPPFEGINNKPGLEEKVMQIILDNIYPPVFPEIQVCQPKNKNTFVIIRIEESDSTPHWVNQKTEIYIRTGLINKPHRIADMNEIEWLRNRREKAIRFREQLYNRTEKRFQNLCKICGNIILPHAEITISSCPLYPSKELKSTNEIKEIKIWKSRPLIYPGNVRLEGMPIQDGWSEFYIKEGDENINYIELSNFGLIYQKRNLLWRYIESGREEKIEPRYKRRIIFLEKIFIYLYAFLELLSYIYKTIGYWGLVDFNFSIKEILNSTLYGVILGKDFLSEGVSLENEVKLKKYISIPRFEDKKNRIKFLIELCREMSLAFGSEVDDKNNSFEKTLERFAT